MIVGPACAASLSVCIQFPWSTFSNCGFHELCVAMDDVDSKINRKFPILDDFLAFMRCKIRVSPRDTLLNVVKSFYNAEDIVKSRDLLFRRLPDSDER